MCFHFPTDPGIIEILICGFQGPMLYMKSLLARLFKRTPQEVRTWTEEVIVEEPSTPVTRYVNFMLIQLCKAGSQTKVLYRNVELPPLNTESGTCEPPRLDDVVKRLKEMCDIEADAHSTPVEGTISCTFEGESFNVKCHFDDNAEACCWIRADKSDKPRNCQSPDDVESDSSAIGGHRVIRYGTPEYRELMRHKARMPWRKRIRRSAICALICTCLVLVALIAGCLILGETQRPVLKMIASALLVGAFIFVMMLFAYAQQDLLR